MTVTRWHRLGLLGVIGAALLPAPAFAESDLAREIRFHLEQCWAPNLGARNAAEMVVALHVEIDRDGHVHAAKIIDQARYDRDPAWRAAADAALRAVFNDHCRTLDLPTEPYEQWKSINITFDPKDLS